MSDTKKYPKTKYTHSYNENVYKCQGSCCSCKYTTPTRPNNFVLTPYQHQQYKPGRKYMGV